MLEARVRIFREETYKRATFRTSAGPEQSGLDNPPLHGCTTCIRFGETYLDCVNKLLLCCLTDLCTPCHIVPDDLQCVAMPDDIFLVRPLHNYTMELVLQARTTSVEEIWNVS